MPKHAGYQKLYTAEGENLGTVPWQEYPRPQLVRRDWLLLNGEWEFSCESGTGTITVPFSPESLLSGFKGKLRYGEKLRYRRGFTLPEEWQGRRIIIHFGAVSRSCGVFINGALAAEHNNAYLPFYSDITDLIKPGENTVEVDCVNDLDPHYPYGKQKLNRGGMWYTPVSGIWQTVWLEPVPEDHIERLIISCDMTGADIEVVGVTEGTVLFDGSEYKLECGKCRIEPVDPKLWSPNEPNLYDFCVKSGEDEVSSYFALRSLSTETVDGMPRLMLNGEPFFFHGLLDQGYFSDGLYTPASPKLFEQDILRMKSLGFNTLRKHIKIEPERFYYDCDRLGMVVFQDMVNNGKYSFLRDTLLPTLGIKRLGDKRPGVDSETKQQFLTAMEETVGMLSNHPSICLWTIFNEGWGQFDADDAYQKLKTLDSSRFIDSTSGWFHRTKTDVDSQHIYFGWLHNGKNSALPQVLSEFGGYVLKLPGHSFNTEKTYGYKLFQNRAKFVRSMRETYILEVVPLAEKGLCASIWTQVSDVEDETNGLLTYDRRMMKLGPDEFADIAEKLFNAVRKKTSKDDE